MNERRDEAVRAEVRELYGQIARGERAGCCAPGSCSAAGCATGSGRSLELGYSDQEIDSVPKGADLGLGCGNPQAIAGLKAGEVVLDLGAGGGFDCFLAAKQVGPTGQVIGVDMTAEMVAKARGNARRVGSSNVEFRLGEIENLPVADASIDVILSNCVINLSPDKTAVFREAFRVLKAGGRLAISDVVATATVPEALARELGATSACIAGAAPIATLREQLIAIGFAGVRINVSEQSRAFIANWMPGSGAENFLAAATIEAEKATASCCGPSCCVGDEP